jgi:cell division septum initiation protein DivIVA
MEPDRLEQIEFSAVRRGFDPDEVRSVLAEAADSLRLLRRRCHELESRVETLEAQVPDPELTEREREAARAEGRAEGEGDGKRLREEGRAQAEALVTEAKEEGRSLVGEAQTVRRRMLEDLARRRRALRQQIEQLRGGRERLLEAYEFVGHTMREATDELTVALPEARAAAERTGHAVGPEETVEQLEDEIESARVAGLPIAAEREPSEAGDEGSTERRRPVAVPVERDVRDMPEVEPVVAEFEEVRILTDDENQDDAPAAGPGAADAEPEDTPGDAEVEDDLSGTGADDDEGDLFARLRRSSPAPDDRAQRAEADPHADDGPGDDGPEAPGDAAFDHPDDAAEPFGLVLGGGPESDAGSDAAGRATAEHELARRLKRLLSDEQNDVLDRLRRTRKRSVTVADLLDDLDVRVARFAEAVHPVLADIASAGPVDDLAAELAREVAEALVDGIVEPLEEDLPVDELADPVRALYRDWKTDRIGAVAERYVEAAYEPLPASE